jgi:hypothetical protein
MKYLFKSVILLLVISCSTPTEKMADSLNPFMTTNFPNASFEIIKQDNLQKLIIKDNGNTLNEDNLESLMTETLGNFYLSFYQSSHSAATDSKLMISYKSDDLTWESESYDLFELGDMFNLTEK